MHEERDDAPCIATVPDERLGSERWRRLQDLLPAPPLPLWAIFPVAERIGSSAALRRRRCCLAKTGAGLGLDIFARRWQTTDTVRVGRLTQR